MRHLKTFNFSKRSDAASEYRRDHTDHHSSGESAQIEKIESVSQLPSQYAYKSVNRVKFKSQSSDFA